LEVSLLRLTEETFRLFGAATYYIPFIWF